MKIISDEKIKKVVGHRIAILRAFYKITQGQLGEKIGCNQRRVASWESGRNLTPTNLLIRISSIFDIPLDFFNPNDEKYMTYLKEEVFSLENTTSQT